MKPKIQPPDLPAQHQTQTTQFSVNPKIDAEINEFMAANPDLVQSYRTLVSQFPERAVRKLALQQMNKQNRMNKQTQREMPQVQQWIDSRPGMREHLTSIVDDANPRNREAFLVRLAKRFKNNIDFRPAAPGAKMSQ